MSEPTRAVLYAAKSTADEHGSIPTQHDDCRALAERDGLEVVGEYQDEAASAFKGNRGAGLQRALDHAERDNAALIVQHSDRLARGDGDQARHLVELVLWARKAGVTLRSVQDPQTFDGMGLVYAALMGDRSHEDSARKSAATRSGLARRKASGKPVGAMPFGYTVDKQVVNAPREVDPASVEHVRAIFHWLENGDTPGAVMRKLNQAGVTTTRGGRWTAIRLRLRAALARQRHVLRVLAGRAPEREVAVVVQVEPGAAVVVLDRAGVAVHSECVTDGRFHPVERRHRTRRARSRSLPVFSRNRTTRLTTT